MGNNRLELEIDYILIQVIYKCILLKSFHPLFVYNFAKLFWKRNICAQVCKECKFRIWSMLYKFLSQNQTKKKKTTNFSGPWQLSSFSFFFSFWIKISLMPTFLPLPRTRKHLRWVGIKGRTTPTRKGRKEEEEVKEEGGGGRGRKGRKGRRR